jgi:hypothetical protein
VEHPVSSDFIFLARIPTEARRPCGRRKGVEGLIPCILLISNVCPCETLHTCEHTYSGRCQAMPGHGSFESLNFWMPLRTAYSFMRMT